MSLYDYESITNTLTTGAIIAIVVGSVCGLIFLIGIIICIVCIVKRSNRSRAVATQGMVLQQPQPYQYPQSWSNQYPPNMTSVANYPPSPYQPTAPPYAAPAQNYY